MNLRVGQRLLSAVCDTEVLVVRAPTDENVAIECGGRPMLPHGSERPDDGRIDPAFSGGTLLGKRYGDESLGLQLLCTRAGAGTLSIDGTAIAVEEPKPLPASD